MQNSSSKFYHLLMLLMFSFLALASYARELTPEDNIQTVFDHALQGDVFKLSAGVYKGNFKIDKSITLEGEPGVILDGNGRADTLRIQAPDVVVRKLEIVNWGDDLTAMNAGIYVEPQATGVLIEDNYLHGDVTGIWLEQASGSQVFRNRIEGNVDLRSSDRGNGIQLNLVTDVEVRDNEVWNTRDGIYIISSQKCSIIGNRVHDLRYGIHYMYSHDNRVENNTVHNTRAGYALMQSRDLIVKNNRSESSQDYGLILNFITYSKFDGNRISGVVQQRDQISGAEGKALFIYNSLYNHFRNNHFSDSEIGVHLTAGSEGNSISGNSFINNTVQVKYVATRLQEWSSEQRGNYWSNYMGWDLDGDGHGDVPFEPNDAVDKLLWKYPEVRVLMNSPAVLMLRWVQRQFPVFKSPGVKDSYPLMRAATEVKS